MCCPGPCSTVNSDPLVFPMSFQRDHKPSSKSNIHIWTTPGQKEQRPVPSPQLPALDFASGRDHHTARGRLGSLLLIRRGSGGMQSAVFACSLARSRDRLLAGWLTCCPISQVSSVWYELWLAFVVGYFELCVGRFPASPNKTTTKHIFSCEEL